MVFIAAAAAQVDTLTDRSWNVRCLFSIFLSILLVCRALLRKEKREKKSCAAKTLFFFVLNSFRVAMCCIVRGENKGKGAVGWLRGQNDIQVVCWKIALIQLYFFLCVYVLRPDYFTNRRQLNAYPARFGIIYVGALPGCNWKRCASLSPWVSVGIERRFLRPSPRLPYETVV